MYRLIVSTIRKTDLLEYLADISPDVVSLAYEAYGCVTARLDFASADASNVALVYLEQKGATVQHVIPVPQRQQTFEKAVRF